MRKDGLTLTGGKKIKLENLTPLKASSVLHAEGEVKQNGDLAKAAISFGPQYGPVTVKQVEEAIDGARWDYQLLIFAGFSFDPEAQAFIQKSPHPKLKLQFAHIRPDILMGDLLKTTSGSQLFTVFGEPDVRVQEEKDGTHVAKVLGIDVYDPISGEIKSSGPEEIAAWFLDTDYDGYVFHVHQAFFPKEATDRNPWDKLERALKGVISLEAIEQLRTTVSLPFNRGEHNRIAAKVIDLYGNEVIRILKLV